MKDHFTVWKGKEPGVFISWFECVKQFEGVENPLFKHFDSLEEAQRASKTSADEYFEIEQSQLREETVSVGLAHSTESGAIRFWAFDNENFRLFFKSPNFSETSIEEGAFLGIVQAMEYMRMHQDIRPIHCSNSKAIQWIKQKTILNHELKSQNPSFIKKTEKAQSLLNSNKYLNDIVLSPE